MAALEQVGKIWIGNIEWSVTSSKLHELFSNYGIIDEILYKQQGFAFITFSTDESASDAISSMHKQMLMGRLLTVKAAIPPKQKEPVASIFVSMVPRDATESDIHEYFSQFGSVLRSKRLPENDKYRSTLAYFIDFEHISGATGAMSQIEHMICGQTIRMEYNYNKKKRNRESTESNDDNERYSFPQKILRNEDFGSSRSQEKSYGYTDGYKEGFKRGKYDYSSQRQFAPSTMKHRDEFDKGFDDGYKDGYWNK